MLHLAVVGGWDREQHIRVLRRGHGQSVQWGCIWTNQRAVLQCHREHCGRRRPTNHVRGFHACAAAGETQCLDAGSGALRHVEQTVRELADRAAAVASVSENTLDPTYTDWKKKTLRNLNLLDVITKLFDITLNYFDANQVSNFPSKAYHCAKGDGHFDRQNGFRNHLFTWFHRTY